MKRALAVTLTAVVALAVGLAAQGAPNLSGTWALDQAKSQMPQMGGGRGGPGGGGGPMTITQTAADLTVERQGPQGTVKAVYKLDGSESVNTTGRGESKSTCKWDGGKLVIKSVSSFQGSQGAMTIEATEIYSLSADGKVLTVDQTRVTQRGEMKSTMVYNKQ